MTLSTPSLRARAAGLALVALAGAWGCSLVDRFSGRREACEILAIGAPATGTIVRLVDTGTTINDDPVVEFVVRVSPDDGDPWEARTKALVSRLDVPALQPGRVVPVKYDPADRSRVALDLWECPKKVPGHARSGPAPAGSPRDPGGPGLERGPRPRGFA